MTRRRASTLASAGSSSSFGAAAGFDLSQADHQLGFAFDELLFVDVAFLKLQLQQDELLAHDAVVVQLLLRHVGDLLKCKLDPCQRQCERRAQKLEEHGSA